MTLDQVIEAAALPHLEPTHLRALAAGRDLRGIRFRHGLARGVLYRGGWRFELAAEAEPWSVPGEYAISNVVEGEMRPYLPPSDLVLRFADLAATSITRPLPPGAAEAASALVERMLGATPSVDRAPPSGIEAIPMRAFLEKWGPLTTDSSSQWAGEFSTPAFTLAEALEIALAELPRAFKIALNLYAEAGPGSLLSVLCVQAIAHFFRGELPKRCPGCARFFRETRERGSAWKRGDAIYCSTACRNRVNKRRSRERKKGATHG